MSTIESIESYLDATVEFSKSVSTHLTRLMRDVDALQQAQDNLQDRLASLEKTLHDRTDHLA